MSWKGTTKAFGRLPQQFRVKTGLRTATRDIQFDDILSRFNELDTRTEKMYKDAIVFRNSVSHLLNHQANIAELLVELYNPVVGKSETESTTRRVTTPIKTMNAIEEFQATMVELRETLIPELDRVDNLVVLPSKDFIDVVKMIKKTITKREHKKVDFDRFTSEVKRLQNKKDKSLSDEKALHKAEDNLEKATDEYNHYNDLLKKELPTFFEFRIQFIEPIVTSFYHLQVKIYGILHEKMDQFIDNTGHFEIQSDIVEHFDERKSEISQQVEDHLTVITKKPSKSGSSRRDNKKDKPIGSKYSSTNSTEKPSNDDEEEDAPPAYSPPAYSPPKTQTEQSSAARSQSNSKLYPIPKKVPPPIPPHGSKPKPKQYVRALYDYDAQAEGDLSFRKDDKIEVIKRTADENDWWKGKLNGNIGDFPGNYVEEW